MIDDPMRRFWQRARSGIEVAVASGVPDKLLGVRDGFLRYFRDATTNGTVPVAVVPQAPTDGRDELPLTDHETLELARDRAQALQSEHGEQYAFYVGTEAGLVSFEAAGRHQQLVRSWTVVLALGEEIWGASGAVQLPPRLIEGLTDDAVALAVPGTRRHGGMVSALTGGLENRRSATSLATLHALSTLFYGRLDGGRPARRRR